MAATLKLLLVLFAGLQSAEAARVEQQLEGALLEQEAVRTVQKREAAHSEQQQGAASEAAASADAHARASWERLSQTFCVSSDAELACDDNSVIKVYSVFYGRNSLKKTCTPAEPGSAAESCSKNGTEAVFKHCQGWRKCALPVSFHPTCERSPHYSFRAVWECVAGDPPTADSDLRHPETPEQMLKKDEEEGKVDLEAAEIHDPETPEQKLEKDELRGKEELKKDDPHGEDKVTQDSNVGGPKGPGEIAKKHEDKGTDEVTKDSDVGGPKHPPAFQPGETAMKHEDKGKDEVTKDSNVGGPKGPGETVKKHSPPFQPGETVMKHGEAEHDKLEGEEDWDIPEIPSERKEGDSDLGDALKGEASVRLKDGDIPEIPSERREGDSDLGDALKGEASIRLKVRRQRSKGPVVEFNPCYRFTRWQMMKAFTPFERLTTCPTNEGCFELKWSDDRKYTNPERAPTSEDIRQAELAPGRNLWVSWWGIGLRRNDYNTWGVCLPTTEGVNFAVGVFNSLKEY